MSPHVYEPTAEANAEREEIQRRIATIDSRLEWLRPHVDEAEQLEAERAELAKALRRR